WEGKSAWQRVKITADQCPRITPEFLAEELQELGERWYRQEYLCSFEDTIDAVFSHADIMAALSPDVQPLSVGGEKRASRANRGTRWAWPSARPPTSRPCASSR